MTTSTSSAENSGPLSIAVIGAGRRGRAFALRCVQAGYDVVLEDVLSSKLRAAEEAILQELPAAQHRLQVVSSVEDAVRNADIAIDFVPDELESKLEILSMMDRMAPPRTIFCTPTQLSITDLASCTYRAGRCVALAPFTEEMDGSVQLILGVQTTTASADAVRQWLRALGCSVSTMAEVVSGDMRS